MSTVGLIVAGLVATAVMTMLILFGSSMKLMPEGWNMLTDGLGGMMNRMMGVPNNMGYAVHFLIGTIIHPFTFSLLWVDTLGIGLGAYVNEIVYALIFAVIMIMMLPMLKAPEGWTSKMAMGVIVAHIMYAVVFASLAGLF